MFVDVSKALVLALKSVSVVRSLLIRPDQPPPEEGVESRTSNRLAVFGEVYADCYLLGAVCL